MPWQGHAYSHHMSGDTVKSVLLDSVVVSRGAMGGPMMMHADGSMTIDLATVSRLPQILGTADPMHYSQMLPGVSVNDEYDGGIRVYGCENGHNTVNLNGVPVYGVSHMLGIFSVFNPSHFTRMDLSKSITRATMPNRLGAVIDMRSKDAIPEKTSGEATVGMIASGSTVDVPTGRQSHLLISLRASYVNFLYSGMLKDDDMEMRYSFYDANVSYSHASGNNVFTADAYWGQDNGSYSGRDINTDADMKWGNCMVTAGWRHHGGAFDMTNKVYFTRYQSKSIFDNDNLYGKARASIEEIGYKGKLYWKSLTCGVEASHYTIRPQGINVNSSFANLSLQEKNVAANEMSAYADYKYHLGNKLSAITGLRGALFWNGGKRFGGLFPSLSVQYDSYRA